jgi:hypothetical protein
MNKHLDQYDKFNINLSSSFKFKSSVFTLFPNNKQSIYIKVQ